MKKLNFSLDSLTPYFDKIAALTKTQKILICVGTLILLIGPAVYFLYIPKHKEIERLTGEYQTLSDELAQLQLKARQINKLKAEVKSVEAEFDEAKKALPESEEIPSLLTSISHAGQDSGLEFLLFQPEKDNQMGFYAEIPVSMRIKGGFHNLVVFFGKVTQLSRIVTIKDIRMTPLKESGKPGETTGQTVLETTCQAVTYRFIEAPPPAPAAPTQ